MKSSIFISYSRQDYDAVITLRNEIYRRTGVLPWMDVSGIETGTQFADVIAAAIDECDLLVFAISPNSVVSHWTTKEVLYAQERRKKIYPVVIEDVRLPRKLAFLFADVDRIDIQNPVQREKFFLDIAAFCGECAYVKTSTRNIHDTPATSPRLSPRHKVISNDRRKSNFLERHKDILLAILILILVVAFVGVPVYIITSRFVVQWIR